MADERARLPWDPADPYPYYERRRAEGEVVWDPDAGAWLVLGYLPARRLLTEKGWTSDPFAAPGAPARTPLGADFVRRTMLFADGAEHRRLRGALRDVFTPPAVAGLAEGVEAITAQLVDTVPAGTPVDLAADIALPLPHAVVAAWMDLDDDTSRELGELAPAVIRALGAIPDGADLAAGAEAAAALTARFLPLAADRRAHPGDDLLSYLAADPMLDLDDVVANTLVVAVAGHETTANALGAGLIRILTDPALAAGVLAGTMDPAHPGLVAELLRLDAPAQAVARTALTEHRIGDVTIAPGEQVLVVLAAGNRDPAAFEDPGRLDPDRDPSTLLSFGHGPHVCIGMALAKLELQIALPRILARGPRLTGAPRWRDIPAIRGPLSVPAEFTR